MHVKFLLLLGFLLLAFQAPAALLREYDFSYRNYDQILQKINELSEAYPFNLRVSDAVSEKIELPDVWDCGQSKCSYKYFVLSDFSQTPEKVAQLPQIFFVAGIHGDEVVGPNVVISLAQYILENYQRNETLKYYVQNRLMIFFPMSNPIGYYRHNRFESHKNNENFDPNRDFPYNVPQSECFRTATGLMINHIYESFLIKTAISFHGGDNSITYPWGGYNHAFSHPYKSDRAPDAKAFRDIAQDLLEVSGENPSKQVFKYLIGTMNEVVYPVNGGLEDWAYAGGWENNFSGSARVIKPCNRFGNANETIKTDRTHIRSALFLVECGDPKNPSEDTLGKIFDDFADIIKRNEKVSFEDFGVQVSWEAGGCFRVSASYLLFKNHDPLHQLNEDFSGKALSEVEGLFNWRVTNNLVDNSSNPMKFSHSLKSSFQQEIDVLLALECDKEWGNIDESSKPLAKPQSHLTLARTSQNYSVENNGFYIKSEKTVYKYIKKVNIQSQKDNDIEKGVFSRENYELEARFHRCYALGSKTDFEDKNFLIFSRESEGNLTKINGKIPYFGSKFKAFVFENNDISYCDNLHLGKSLDLWGNTSLFESAIPLLNSSSLFFESDRPQEEISMTLSSGELWLELIGRSILLYNEEKEGEFLIAQMNILQNHQCGTRAMNCLSQDLRKDNGLCLLTKEFKMRDSEDFLLKIMLKNEGDSQLEAQLVLDFRLISEVYDPIDKVIIWNEGKSLEFPIVNRNFSSNAFVSELKIFDLAPQNALSNRILIQGENKDRRFDVGVCSIGKLDKQDFYFETEEIVLESRASNLWISVVSILALFLTLFGLCIRYNKVNSTKEIKQIYLRSRKNEVEAENHQFISADRKSSENLGEGVFPTTTPKFLDIENNHRAKPQTLNEDMDSDKI